MPGVLYARVSGAWVPVSSAAAVPIIPPPVRLGPRTAFPRDAQLGNIYASANVGFVVGEDGTPYAIVPSGVGLSLWNRTADDSGFDQNFASLAKSVSRLNVWRFSDNGKLDINGSSGNQWVIYATVNDTYLNGLNGLNLQVAGLQVVTVAPTKVTTHKAQDILGQLWCAMSDAGNAQWNGRQVIIAPTGGSAGQVMLGMSMYYPGVAPQWTQRAGFGEGLFAMANPGTTHCPIAAKQFNVGAVAAEIITPRSLSGLTPTPATADPDADVVDGPDVMALEPLAFRLPPVPAIVPTDPDVPVDPQDDTTFTTAPLDPTSLYGREGIRERLGLNPEDVMRVIPSAVSRGPDGKAYGIDYAQVTVALLNHVQTLTTRLAAVEAQLAGASPA